MHIHEYQAKQLLKKYGITVPAFEVISHLDEVGPALQRLGGNEAVVKVQIHAGGRGKAGGVKFGKNPQEIKSFCKELLGKKIVNNQTGPQGLISEKIMISRPVNIKKEYYLAALIDRATASCYIVASSEGGTEIEEVAREKPEAIFKEKIGLDGTLRGFQLFSLTKSLGWQGDLQKKGSALISKLALAFTQSEALLFEINPLVETAEGELLALDAKCTLDENALFRHKEFESFYDPSQQTPNEVEAAK